MRGKDRIWLCAGRKDGITPAYAGKSSQSPCRNRYPGDHPRVCGEKLYFDPSTGTYKGSPPRMRGKGNKIRPFVGDVGITPAYAGKSFGMRRRTTPAGDHPRVCGEKAYQIWPADLRRGSPPRMRGKVGDKLSVAFSPGITPAYAGKRL